MCRGESGKRILQDVRPFIERWWEEVAKIRVVCQWAALPEWYALELKSNGLGNESLACIPHYSAPLSCSYDNLGLPITKDLALGKQKRTPSGQKSLKNPRSTIYGQIQDLQPYKFRVVCSLDLRITVSIATNCSTILHFSSSIEKSCVSIGKLQISFTHSYISTSGKSPNNTFHKYPIVFGNGWRMVANDSMNIKKKTKTIRLLRSARTHQTA